MAAPHHTDAPDPVHIDTPHSPGHSEDSSGDSNSSVVPIVGDPNWKQLDHEGVASSGGVIVPETPNFDTDAPDAVYTGRDSTVDPSIMRDIRQMLLEVWDISVPREWQLRAIYLMAHGRARELRRLLLVRRTGDGKSLVIYGLATLLRGVTIVIVPIQALGSDQVSTFWSMANPIVNSIHYTVTVFKMM